MSDLLKILFSSKLTEKLDALLKKIDQLNSSLNQSNERLAKLEEKLNRPQEDRFRKDQKPRFKKPENIVYDLHGNAVPVGGAMNLKGHMSSTRNPRKCKVWGCNGQNFKDGYCEKHHGKYTSKDTAGNTETDPNNNQ